MILQRKWYVGRFENKGRREVNVRCHKEEVRVREKQWERTEKKVRQTIQVI
jgi:hypothetical protein